MLPVFSQPEGRVFRRSGASLLGVPQPVTDPFRAALMRVFSSSSFYPDFYGIKTSEKKKKKKKKKKTNQISKIKRIKVFKNTFVKIHMRCLRSIGIQTNVIFASLHMIP